MSRTSGPVENQRTGLWIRVATPRDAPTVRELDNLCFPSDSLEKERARPGELERGVEVGDVQLLENSDGAVGYVHADTTDPRQIYVAGLAVHPDHQQRGYGTWLVEKCLALVSPAVRWRQPIVTVTSPRNYGMLRILFRHGFGARWLSRNHFGPGKDRFGLQLRRTDRWATSARRWTMDLEEVYLLVEKDGLMARALGWRSGVPYYGLSAYDITDFAPDARFP
jgi:ribosomal protein S18 acetylase RimI-like enzyme